MILVLLIALGLVLGSFINALVWRMHEGRDWIKERSECVRCHHKLGPLDLIPVISWLLLRGRCRYCHKRIEDSPLVELALPTLFVLSYLCWPATFSGTGLLEFICWLFFLVGFTALAVYDLRWYLLPNKIVFPLVGLAILQVFAVTLIDQDFWHLLWSAVGALTISGIFYLLFQMSRGTWIGGGDVKLGIVLGLLAGGVIQSFLLLFIASIVGVLVSLPMLVRGKAGRKTQLPFGPLLIIGMIVVTLFGPAIINWYTSLVYV